MDILQTLHQRGFLKQITHEKALSRQLAKPTTFYVGIDPTGSSLHIGHLVPLLASVHLARGGHRPLFVLGGGTALIGDPSGKTQSRLIQTREQIKDQSQTMGSQIIKLMESLGVADFLVVNNADWLEGLSYIDFLRDIGCHFSVNRMLSFETYKKRLTTGLSFLEFNYQVLQSYDFLQLFERYNCCLQVGGDDQWGNIVAGIDLIRRVKNENSYGMTFPLVTKSDGAKMGKTEKGAIFIDPALTSAYEMYQYWRNVSDGDVRTFLLLYTFLERSEIEALTSIGGEGINQAKERLALEATRWIHGEFVAHEAQIMSRSLFSGEGEKDQAPKMAISRNSLASPMTIIDFCVMIGICSSKGSARRMIDGGGLYLNNERVKDTSAEALLPLLGRESILVRQGKKKYLKVVFS